MSLFIGKDNSNKPLLHITKGINTAAQMKSGLLTNSIFHSSLPYLEVTEIPVTNIRTSSNRTHATISSADAALLNSEDIAYCFVVDGQVYAGGSSLKRTSVYEDNNPWTFLGISTQSSYGAWAAPGKAPNYGSSFTYSPSSSYNEFTMLGEYSNVRCFKFNIKNKNFIPQTDTDSQVLINKDHIWIGSKDLLSYSYLNRGQINDVDPIATIPGGTVQFINIDTSGDIQMQSKADTGKTEILRNGKPIFSTDGEGKVAYRGAGNTSFAGRMVNGYSRAATYTSTIPFSALGLASQADLSFFYAYLSLDNWQTVRTGGKEINTGLVSGNYTSYKTLIYNEEYAHSKTWVYPSGYRDYWDITDTLSYRVTSTGIEFKRDIHWWCNYEYYFTPITINVLAFG
jgi:hypothetical protein